MNLRLRLSTAVLRTVVMTGTRVIAASNTVLLL
jgi:hypothetical protein